MVYHVLLADILLIARIFPRPCGARKNTTQLAKYPRVLYVKPSNKMYILTALGENIFRIFDCDLQILLVFYQHPAWFISL